MTRIHPTTEMAVDATEDGPVPEPLKKDQGFQEVSFSPPIYDDEDEDAPTQLYEPSTCEKIINYMLCRTDLATQKLTMQPVSLAELFRFANKTDWILLFMGVLCAICAGVGHPVLALISGRIANVLIMYPPRTHQFKNKAYENVYIFLGVGVFCLFVNFFQYYFFQTVCNRIITRLKYHYVASIIRQNAGWFDKNHSGALTTTLNDNIDRIREGIGEKLGLLIRGFGMLIAAIVISFIYQWRLSLLMLGVTPSTCVVMSFLSQKMGSTTMKELADVGKAGAIAEESVLGVRTVQACNGQEEMVERYAAELDKGKKFGIQKGYWSGFFGGLFFFILFTFLGCGVLYGAYLLKVGIFKHPGDVFICIMAMLLGAYFLGLVSPHLMVLLNARVAAAVIYATIDRVPRIDVYSEEGERPPNPIGRVEFKNVHFRYPTRKNAKILNGLNLVIEPGQTVALVGHSGCGKSTTVGLLTRLYESEAGDVTIDGLDVRKFNIHYLRHICGTVQQEPILFNATIAENLKIGFPDCTRERMVEVCKMANAHGFIQMLPNGYDTMVGDGGVQLSGGQKQRIAIARTLARDPKVLLLDEATSALDAQSESVVQSALDNAAKGRTTIMIAHRLSTIRNADKIVVFEKGEIVEQGNHHELVRLGGRYAALVKAQQFVPDDETEPEDEIDLGDPYETKIATYDFPPDSAPVRTHRFDDVSRQSSSSSFGKQAFVRGASINDSMSRRSENLAGIDVYGRTPDEVQRFMAEVAQTMSEDDRDTYNIITIYKNAKGQYLLLILGFIASMFFGVQLPAMSLAFTYVFQSFQYVQTDPGHMMNRCVRALGIFLGIGAASWLAQFLASVFLGHASENLTMKLRIAAFRNILYQDAGYFDNPAHTAGKLITRLASDAPNVKAVIDSRLMQVVQGTTAVMVALIIAFVYSWQIALLGILYLSMLAFSLIYLAYKVMATNMNLARTDEAGRISIEIIENVRTIQLLTRETYFNNYYTQAAKQQKKAEMTKCIYEALNNCITQTNIFFLSAIAYSLGIHIIYVGQKDSSNVFQAITAMILAAVAIMHSASYFPEFVKANSSSRLLFSIIFRKPKTGDSSVGEKAEIRGNILFEKIKFTYPQKPNQPVMIDLNFTALRGQTVALVGPSGCGKSTIISMLERFYDVSGGALRLDGKDIRTLCLDHLRTQMALVGQEPRLFAGTIRENVMFGLRGQVTDEQINKALDLANARRFINNLPSGIETEVGEKGTQMSGGQKQRIAIARALVRDPKILLLDEATSALDSESERAVQEALDRAREGRTCITIAHRLSSIQNSDVILYIENGKVQEFGNHQVLMQRRGKYYDLIRKQDLVG